MNKLDLQTFLFEGEVSRMELINYVPTIESAHRVLVYRNHSFELIENTIKPYLEYAGLGVDFIYSDYDDSLSFLELDISVDVVILWLDLSVYNLSDLNEFIESRVIHLRNCFNGSILFVPCGSEIQVEIPQVEQYKLSKLEAELEDKFFDLRLETFSGTKLSHLANLEISRDLGLNYLPALLKPNLKCVVVDLDNTLYHGVLGEDGISGIVLTDNHHRLQTQLKKLSKQGFFLCIASKNDERDVINLFDERLDFPLRNEDFTKVCANWENKSDSIKTIVNTLNISVDSLLFIDDNLGELLSVLEVHPLIKLIWAKDDACITYDVLSNYPGLLKLSFTKEDNLRKDDILANEERRRVQNSLNKEQYIQDLKMELVYEVDDLRHLARVTELSNKTNQFIFSYQRYSAQEIEALMKDSEVRVVTVSLNDRLSDSGVVGVVVLKKQKEFSLLEECFVSCRALGRGIDQLIVSGAIKVAMKSLGVKKLMVKFNVGERNLPAEKYCEKYFHIFKAEPNNFIYEMPKETVTITIK